MKKLVYLAFVAVALFLTASCDREGVIYQPVEGEACVTFRAAETIVQVNAEDAPTFQVELLRGLTADALSIPVTITDANGIFTADKSQFDFAAGENKAVITFTYVGDDVEYGEEYEIDIELNDPSQTSVSGYDATTVVLARKMTKVSKGKGTYTSGRASIAAKQVEFFATAEKADLFTIAGPYKDGFDMMFTVVAGQPVFGFTAFNTGLLDPQYGSNYGNLYLYLGGAAYAEGVIALSVTYCVIAGGGLAGIIAGVDTYALPAGVTL